MSGARALLRTATAADHVRLDALFERFDLADAGDYARFLAAHAAAIAAVEAALDTAGFARVMPDWPERRRAGLVRDDLATLGIAPPAPLPAPILDGEAVAWGAAYVVEGSRLGGALLARSVAEGLPVGYLAAAQPKGAWRAFLAALDQAITTDADQQRAVAGAHATFALFERAGAAQLPGCSPD